MKEKNMERKKVMKGGRENEREKYGSKIDGKVKKEDKREIDSSLLLFHNFTSILPRDNGTQFRDFSSPAFSSALYHFSECL